MTDNKKTDPVGSIIKWILFIVIVGVLCLTQCGCYTKKIASKQVTRAQALYPDLVAGNCGDWYPPKESTVTETKYLPGKPIPGKTNYVTVDCDSAIKVTPGKVRVYNIPCPPCDSLRVDTFTHTEIKTVENTAKIKALTAEVDKLRIYQVVMWCLSGLLLIVFLILYIILKRQKNADK